MSHSTHARQTAVLILLQCVVSGLAFGDQRDLILADLAARSNAFDVVKIEWVEQQFFAAGHISYTFPYLTRDTANPVPPDDAAFESRHSLLLSGDLMRYSGVKHTWHQKHQRYVERVYDSTFDGTSAATMTSTETSPRTTVTLDPAKRNLDKSLASLRAVFMALRPLDFTRTRIPIDSLEIIEGTVMYNSIPCQRLAGRGLGGGDLDLYVTIDRPFRIVGAEVDRDRPVSRTWTIDYEAASEVEHVLRPIRWNYVATRMDTQEVLSIASASLTMVDNASAIDKARFKIDPPKDARVFDRAELRQSTSNTSAPRFPLFIRLLFLALAIAVMWLFYRLYRKSVA